MDTARSRSLGIICEPAECDADCDICDCPYMHYDIWRVGETPYYTLHEATIAAISQANEVSGPYNSTPHKESGI